MLTLSVVSLGVGERQHLNGVFTHALSVGNFPTIISYNIDSRTRLINVGSRSVCNACIEILIIVRNGAYYSNLIASFRRAFVRLLSDATLSYIHLKTRA